MLKRIYKEVIKDFGARTFNDIQASADEGRIKEIEKFSVLTEDIEKYINVVSAKKVVLINETTRKDIKRIVSKAVQEGQSIPNMKKAIDGLYLDNIIPNRSRTIARTEVVSASNYGSFAGAKQTPSRLKKVWIPTFDDSTRESHLAMANHPAIGLYETFNVNGSYGQYPGDFNLPASEVINCRCAIGYEYVPLPKPEPIAPKPITPKPVTPKPEPIVPKPVTPKPVEPKPIVQVPAQPITDITQLKESIINKNKSAFKHLPNAAEVELQLKEILDKASTNDLIVYNKLSDFVENNDYNYKPTQGKKNAHYSGAQNKVFMNISNKNWEAHVGSKYKVGFSTKFHEEFHQLDRNLAGTSLTKDKNGKIINSILDSTNTINGKKIYDSAEKDILKAINDSIDWSNKFKQTNIAKLTDLKNISPEVKTAFGKWMNKNYNADEDGVAARIALFTDAFGGITKGQLSPIKMGYWGHDENYYLTKTDVVGSEIFAEYGAYKFVYDNNTRNMINKLMPETIKTLDTIFEEIAEHLKNNDLKIKK